jgi:hypothetical protein
MDSANELSKILSLYFIGNKARINGMANLLIGLLKSRTTNLTKVAINMPGDTKIDSKYRRIQRFFNAVIFDRKEYISLVIKQLPMDKKYVLILDRTNCKFGTKDNNFLVLSIAWQGIAIPLVWFDLNKAGNSNTEDRMKVISEIVSQIGIEKIHSLLGDREFIGEDWLHWLAHYNIKFVFRIKENSLLCNENKKVRAYNSFKNLKPGKHRVKSCNLWGLNLSVVGCKDKSQNIWILATNGDPDEAKDLYAMRWQIETMFFCLVRHESADQLAAERAVDQV